MTEKRDFEMPDNVLVALVIVCLASGVSRASAFVLAAKPSIRFSLAASPLANSLAGARE